MEVPFLKIWRWITELVVQAAHSTKCKLVANCHRRKRPKHLLGKLAQSITSVHLSSVHVRQSSHNSQIAARINVLDHDTHPKLEFWNSVATDVNQTLLSFSFKVNTGPTPSYTPWTEQQRGRWFRISDGPGEVDGYCTRRFPGCHQVASGYSNNPTGMKATRNSHDSGWSWHWKSTTYFNLVDSARRYQSSTNQNGRN